MTRYITEPKDEKRKRRGRILLRIVFFVALAVFLISGGMLLKELVIEPYQNQKELEKYRDLMKPASTSSAQTESKKPAESTESTTSTESAPAEILESFRALYEMNADIAGWLTIPDTELDHPVFYTPDDQNYYLKRDPDGSANKYGSLYLSSGSTLEPQAQVMVMYGHNMEQDDRMFGQLNKFKQLSFLQEHPTFTFDTIYRTGEWKIIAVCRASTDEMNVFPYNMTQYDSADAFNAFIKQARVRSMYRIPDDVNETDSLLVLSTCDYLFYGDRLVVIARRLRDGETAETIDTARYERNDVMLWPEVYYSLSYATTTKPTDEETERAYTQYYGAS